MRKTYNTMDTFPFPLPCYCALISNCVISWIWPFVLFVGGGGVRAEDQEPPDQGEETAGQGRGVPRGAGGHPLGWVFPQPPTMGLKGPPQYSGLHHIKTGLNHPQWTSIVHLSSPHYIKTGFNHPQRATKVHLKIPQWPTSYQNRPQWPTRSLKMPKKGFNELTGLQWS